MTTLKNPKTLAWVCSFLALVTVVLISSLPASAASQGVCPKIRKYAPAGKVPVWVKLEIRTPKNALVTDLGLTIRQYGIGSDFTRVGRVWSGCFTVLFYNPKKVPSSLCISVKGGLRAPNGACLPVTSGPAGKEVRFSLIDP